jgi:hypothetical protein
MDAKTTTDAEIDAKKEKDQDLENVNIEQLKEYFQSRKSEHEVTVRWNSDSDSQRFYFVRDSKNEYILDVKREVLQDSASNKIIARIEAAKWEQTLKSHPHQVVCFTGNGFTFHGWPG